MSPHGTPDWGLVGPKNITYGLDDLGEHAVRLGSPHLWDRRGDVVYSTCFREGLGMFHTQILGVGAAVELVTGCSRQGAYSILLRPGSALGDHAMLQLAFPFQDLSAVGLEFSFSLALWTYYIAVQINWYNGALERRGQMRYYHTTHQLYYLNGLGAWVLLPPDIPRHGCIRPEHTLKLVVDMDRSEYVRFLLDELSYDLRGLAVAQAPDPRPPYWYFTLWHYGVATHNPDCHIDNVIVTQNEPR